MEVCRVPRCPTGILELDKLLEGGIPRGSVVVLAGAPGTGKTVFSAKFVYEGAVRYGEPGVYLNFLETRKEFLSFMRSLGMDFENLESKGLFKYIEGFQVVGREGVGEVVKALLSSILQLGAKRVVIDSVSALTQVIDRQGIREILKNVAINGLKRFGVTSILTLEVGRASKASDSVGEGIEEYLADGLIVLSMTTERDHIIRKLRIKKMRGSPIPYSSMPFEIVSGDVIRIYPPVRLEEIPPPSREVIYKFGNELIDSAFGGGICKGAQIAVVSEVPKSGFHVALCTARALALRYGGKLMVRSYVQSPPTLRMLEDACDRVRGIQLFSGPRRDYEVYHVSVNPTTKPLYLIAVENRSLDMRIKEDFLVTGPLDIMYVNSPEFFREHVNNVWYRKRLGITAFYVFHHQTLERRPQLFEVYDYIAVLKHKMEEGRPCIKITLVNALSFTPPTFLLLCYDIVRQEYTLKLKEG